MFLWALCDSGDHEAMMMLDDITKTVQSVIKQSICMTSCFLLLGLFVKDRTRAFTWAELQVWKRTAGVNTEEAWRNLQILKESHMCELSWLILLSWFFLWWTGCYKVIKPHVSGSALWKHSSWFYCLDPLPLPVVSVQVTGELRLSLGFVGGWVQI